MKIVIRKILVLIIDISKIEEDLMVDLEAADPEVEVGIVVEVDSIKEIDNMDIASKTKEVTITKQ